MISPTSDTLQMVKSVALSYQLDPVLVMAIIEQESSWDSLRVRFEPGWFGRGDWDSILSKTPWAVGSSRETEIATRSMSWGLMQALGQTAREKGFSGWLPTLANPQWGVQYGCIILMDKLKAAKGDIEKGLLLWNGGGNLAYPGQVLAREVKYR